MSYKAELRSVKSAIRGDHVRIVIGNLRQMWRDPNLLNNLWYGFLFGCIGGVIVAVILYAGNNRPTVYLSVGVAVFVVVVIYRVFADSPLINGIGLVGLLRIRLGHYEKAVYKQAVKQLGRAKVPLDLVIILFEMTRMYEALNLQSKKKAWDDYRRLQDVVDDYMKILPKLIASKQASLGGDGAIEGSMAAKRLADTTVRNKATISSRAETAEI